MRNQITLETLKGRIFRIRGQQVMLGQDLAQLYASTPGALMQAVKRNAFRFPVDFMFQLSEAEFDRLKSQIGLGLNNSVENFSVAGNDRSQPDERCSPTQKRLGIGSTARST